MIELSSSALEWAVVGCLLTIAGALIKFRGWTFLLAGYDESSSIPDDVVQNVAGNTILRIGIAVLAVGVLESTMRPPPSLGVLVGTAIALDVLRMVYRVNTWSSRAT